MPEFVNGDEVRITAGPRAGLTGMVGGTQEDGWVEVIMVDLDGPADEHEEFEDPANLAHLD